MFSRPEAVPSPKEIIVFPLEHGFSDAEIVRELTRGRIYRDTQQIARDYAPLLGLSVTEFMERSLTKEPLNERLSHDCSRVHEETRSQSCRAPAASWL